MHAPSSLTSPPARHLVLGSSSRYRKELLARLRLPFTCFSPDIDESALAGEAPRDLAARLAMQKAQAVAARFPEAIVIGSDQVADLGGRALGKPLTHERATEQLRQMRGKVVVFQTAVTVCCQESGFLMHDMAQVRVQFRSLSDGEIETYLRAEQPYGCAGSAKSEGLGIALLASIDNDDPTALVGLPLIRTAHMLMAAGMKLL